MASPAEREAPENWPMRSAKTQRNSAPAGGEGEDRLEGLVPRAMCNFLGHVPAVTCKGPGAPIVTRCGRCGLVMAETRSGEQKGKNHAGP